MKPAKIYTITVPAGGALPQLVQGSFLKLLSATGDVEVRGDTFGTIGTLLAGQGLRDIPFARLEFRDMSGADNKLRFLVADAGFVDDRISGSVEIIDGNKARTISAIAFGGSWSAPAVAGQLSYMQLYNPAASLKRIVLEALRVTATVGPWAVDVYPKSSGALAATQVTAAACKQVGAANSSAAYRLGASAGVPAGVGLPMQSMGGPSAFVYDLYRFAEPVVIGPDQSIVIIASASNTNLIGNLEFFEEVIL